MDNNSNNPSDNNPEITDNRSSLNSNLAILIVVVAGILLCALLLLNAPAEDMVSPTPGPGTPQISQPIATPPTAVQPTAVQPTAVQPTAPPVQPSPIQGINWQWISVTDQSTGEITTVPSPQQYTLVFNTDGTINGVADCNTFTGKYSQENGMNIKITSMTRAACPEGSLDQQYIQLLENVAAGGPDGSGNLALETAGGAQRMVFRNGGPAQ
jgi:heat shock protein HslJ